LIVDESSAEKVANSELQNRDGPEKLTRIKRKGGRSCPRFKFWKFSFIDYFEKPSEN
jgi:hypothetical protein